MQQPHNTDSVHGAFKNAGVGVVPPRSASGNPYSAATATATTSSYASSYASSTTTPPSAAQNMEIFRQTFVDPLITDQATAERVRARQSTLALDARLRQQLQTQQMQMHRLQQMQMQQQEQQLRGQSRQQSAAEQMLQYRNDILKKFAEIGDDV